MSIASGGNEDAIAVFSRNVVTGELTFVEVQKDGVGGVDGLRRARSVTVSPDGEHVYVAGFAPGTIAVFSRNAATGELTFVEVQTDGVGGVDDLFGAFSVTVSPDGEHVYVTSVFDDAVTVFSRNAVTGELTLVEVQKDGVDGVDGLDGASSVTVSPDGEHVYATGEFDHAVAVFAVASGTCVAPPAGLVSWWPMDGSTADISDGNSASAQSALSFVGGKVNDAVQIGTGDFIDIASSANLQNQQFTIDAWVRPDGIGPNDDSFGSVIVAKSVSGSESSALLNWNEIDGGRFLFSSGPSANKIVSANIFPPGQLYHVAATYDGATMKLYVDGVLEASRATTHPVQYNPTLTWNIGVTAFTFRGGFARTWNGLIDEVDIFNRALSQLEIQAIQGAGSAGKCHDTDNDTVFDIVDNCPLVANPLQENNDGDAEGDVCDADDDNDTVLDDVDNCPFLVNPLQENNDGDAEGDVCDPDDDNDTVLDGTDNCPFVFNPDQEDTNMDGFGDACVDPSVDVPDNADVDPTATIEAGSEIDKGVTVEAGAEVGSDVVLSKDTTVGSGSSIGDNVMLDQGVILGSDVIIEDNVSIEKNTLVGDGVVIGANSQIGPDNTIEANANVGANCVGPCPDPNVVTKKMVTISEGAVVPPGTEIPKEQTFP